MTQDDRRGKHCAGIVLSVALFPVCVMAAAGCGAPAAPLPPTLNLPQPVHDLAATRVGNTVHVTFSVPQKTTDKLPVRGTMTARLCRSVESGPCLPAVSVAIPAQQKSFSMDDNLPPQLTQGPVRLLAYKLSVLNRAGKSDEESSPVYAGRRARPSDCYRIHRHAATKRHCSLMAGSRSPRRSHRLGPFRSRPHLRAACATSNRTVRHGPRPPHRRQARSRAGRADTARLRERGRPPVLRDRCDRPHRQHVSLYRATHLPASRSTDASSKSQVSPASRSTPRIAMSSRPPSRSGWSLRQTRPSRSIDLDWTPDVDPGLAGYIVYRRAAGTSEAPQRISPAGKPIPTSSWSDTTATPGQRYAYSVSAIDLSGNESQRSAEVEDQWNAPGSQPDPQPAQHP